MIVAREALVLVVLAALPWATSVQEIGLALLLTMALFDGRARAFLALPWALPALATAGAWVLASFASGDVREGLGHAWLLAPVVALAGLAPGAESRRRRELVGLGTAAAAAALAIGQAVQGAAATGAFSHHLTLAYALVVPFGVALAARRWAVAATLAAGVLATRSDAAPVALLATAAAALGLRPGLAAALGAALTLAGLRFAARPDELAQRAVLWTGGLLIPPGHAGAGGYRAASAPIYESLQPGFWFPNHAHDAFVQLAATAGAAGWVATLALVVVAFTRGARGAAAGLVGVLVGALTQDTLGDLEVARAAWVWLAILGTSVQDEGLAAACSPSRSLALPSPEPSIKP